MKICMVMKYDKTTEIQDYKHTDVSRPTIDYVETDRPPSNPTRPLRSLASFPHSLITFCKVRKGAVSSVNLSISKLLKFPQYYWHDYGIAIGPFSLLPV